MARYRGPRLRIIRRLGENLPGLMCIDEKKIEKQHPPGEHGKNKRNKVSDYQLHLKEKQKLRYHYGVLEKQLRRYSKSAFNSKDNTEIVLLSLLERRFDNVVYRSGFFRSIKAARQAVNHGHLLLNNKKNDIPSCILNINDVVSFKANSKIARSIVESNQTHHNIFTPSYLNIDNKLKMIKVVAEPLRKDVPININGQLVVEYYSGR